MSIHTFNQPLDTSIRVETSEAVDLVLYPASAMARSRAYLLDTFIRILGLILSTFLLGFVSPNIFGYLGLMGLNIFFWFFLYFPISEVFFRGQSIGKKVFKLRVVQDDGTDVTFSSSLLRNLLRLVDMLPMFYATGISVMLLNSRGQRIGDMFAGTLVVFVPVKSQVKIKIPIWKNLVPMSPPRYLTRAERQAIVSFAERYTELSKARQKEIAHIIVDALAIQNNCPDTDTVLAIAKHLLGESKGERK